MSISERILKIRKANGLSRAAFGEKIGVSQDVINNIERGRNKNGVPDSIVKLIAITFNVNEEWLRTGSGTMEKQVNKKDELTKAFENILTGEKNSFKERLVSVLLRLNENDWAVLATIAQKMFDESNSPEGSINSSKPEQSASDEDEAEIQRLVERRKKLEEIQNNVMDNISEIDEELKKKLGMDEPEISAEKYKETS